MQKVSAQISAALHKKSRILSYSEALCSLPAHEEIIVISQPCAPLATLSLLAKPEQKVIDVNGWRELEGLAWSYEGLCW